MSENRGETTIRVIEFSGNKNEYEMWSERFMAFAASKKYGGILSGRVIVPKVKDVVDSDEKEDSKMAEIFGKEHQSLCGPCSSNEEQN